MKRSLIWSLTIILLVSALVPAQTSSQTAALPNRSDTITYLDKRANELVGMFAAGFDDARGYFYKHTVYQDGDGKISILRDSGELQKIPFTGPCDSSSLRILYTFRPSQITDVRLTVDSGEIGWASIYLTSPSAKRFSILFGYSEAIAQGLSGYGSCTFWKERSRSNVMVSKVDLAFLSTDKANFAKLKKALLHLRDLDKATDDPFGE